MPTCSKERRKKIAINYGKTKEEINLTTTTKKKVQLKKENKLKRLLDQIKEYRR